MGGGTGGLVVEEHERDVSQDTPYFIVSYYSVQQFFHKTYENLATVMNIVPMQNFLLRNK